MTDDTLENIPSSAGEDIPSTATPVQTSPPPSDTLSLIERSENSVKAMQEQNDRSEKLIERQESVAARMLLGGRAEAGGVNKTKAELEADAVDKQVDDALKTFL